MNAFEKGLRREIPLEKAAAFFCSLKNGGRQVSAEDDALMAAAVKQASVAPPMVPAPPPPPPALKEACAKFAQLAELFKTAGEDGMPAGTDALPAPQSGEKDPAGYLQTEMDAQAAEDQGSVEYYQHCLQELRMSTEAAEQRAQEAEAQLQELQGQQQAHEQQLAASQQEMQIASQAAMQQVEQANAMATQAMSGQVAASNQALQAKAMETTAKVQGQQLRTQLFDLASTGLPGTEPDVGGEGNPAEGVEPLGTSQDAAAAEGAVDPNDPNAATATGEGADGTGEAGVEDGSADGQLAAGGQESGAGGDAGAESGGAGTAAAAPGAEAGPGAEPGTPDAGATPAVPPQAPAAPPGKPPGQVSIKVGSAEHRAKIAAGLPDYLRRPEIIGALAGGVGGAGLAAAEANGDGSHLDKLRQKVTDGEAAAAQPGLKGFAQSFELAKDRVMQTLGEATQNHPVAATITGGLAGAGAGYAAGPHLKSMVSEAVAHHKG